MTIGPMATLVDELHAIGRRYGLDLTTVRTGRNRFAKVDAMLLTHHGHVDAYLRNDGHVDVTVWSSDRLAAWGTTADREVVAKLMDAWNTGIEPADLAAATDCLTLAMHADAEAVIAQQWLLLLTYGDGYLQLLAKSVHASKVLLRLRPWVSHGTLYLVSDLPEPRNGLAFHPSGSRWRVGIYDGALSAPLDDTQAIEYAAAAAHGWTRT